MFYIYVENGRINGAGECEILDTDTIKNMEVSEKVYKEFINDTRKYIYDSGKIILNPDYEKVKKQEEIENKINDINEKLSILDLKRIRAVCEDEIRDEKTGETWLDFYNSQIYNLRVELKSLESEL